MSHIAKMAGRFYYPGETLKYVLGGHATFTIKLPDRHFTYSVKSGKKDKDKNWSTGNADRSFFFVSLLSGPNDFNYIGMLKQDIDGVWVLTRTAKSARISESAPSWQELDRMLTCIQVGCRMPAVAEFWHEGQCCVCGRPLTVPESIAAGIGPDCAGGY